MDPRKLFSISLEDCSIAAAALKSRCPTQNGLRVRQRGEGR